MTTDLIRLKEQRDYESWDEEGERKGRLWYRNCRTGCSAFQSFELGVLTPKTLAVACAECQLLPGAGQQAKQVEMVWTLPDGSLHMTERPYWYVSAVSFLRLINRAPGF